MLTYLSFFMPTVIELIFWDLRPSAAESLCQTHVSVIGPPHALILLFLNMALALTDRYIAINHPVWYRERMIISLSCSIVVLSFVLSILFVIKFVVLIVGVRTPHCEVWRVHANLIGTVLVLLLVSCAILFFIGYVQTKLYQCEKPISSLPFINNSAAVLETANVEWIELLASSADIESQNERALPAINSQVVKIEMPS
jgi:hypothetical protein